MLVVVDGGTIGEHKSRTDVGPRHRRTILVEQRDWANLRCVDDRGKVIGFKIAVNRKTPIAFNSARAMEARFDAPSTLRPCIA